MIISMSIFCLSLYSLLLLHPSIRNGQDGSASRVPGRPQEISPPGGAGGWSVGCTDDDRQNIWQNLPHCQPRKMIVSIPQPLDPDIVQYIPSHTEVARCSGTCYEKGELYQSCVAKEKIVTIVPVLYERVVGRGTEEVCGEVAIETHRSCECGCEPLECASNQEFHNRTCTCRCKDIQAMGQCLVQHNKIWDKERCSCRCRAEEWKECNTGFSYDGVYTCQCLPGPPISASTGITVTLVVIIIVLSVGLGLMYRRSRNQLLEVAAKTRDGSADERKGLQRTESTN